MLFFNINYGSVVRGKSKAFLNSSTLLAAGDGGFLLLCVPPVLCTTMSELAAEVRKDS